MLDYNDVVVMSGTLVSMIFTGLIIFLIMGNGYAQFGARYTLDFHIMALLFILFMLKVIKSRYFYYALFVLILLSVYINYFGARIVHEYNF